MDEIIFWPQNSIEYKWGKPLRTLWDSKSKRKYIQEQNRFRVSLSLAQKYAKDPDVFSLSTFKTSLLKKRDQRSKLHPSHSKMRILHQTHIPLVTEKKYFSRSLGDTSLKDCWTRKNEGLKGEETFLSLDDETTKDPRFPFSLSSSSHWSAPMIKSPFSSGRCTILRLRNCQFLGWVPNSKGEQRATDRQGGMPLKFELFFFLVSLAHSSSYRYRNVQQELDSFPSLNNSISRYGTYCSLAIFCPK